MGNWKAALPITLSLVIAIGGSYFLYQWIEKQRAPKAVIQVQAEAVPVSVSVGNLPWGTKLKPEMLKTTPYLKQSLPAGYFSNLNDIQGRILIAPLKANEPITEHKLAPISMETGGVSAVLAPGKRAIGVKGDKVIGLAGFVNPGNHVDVLVTVKDPDTKKEKTKTILERIPVLATGTQIEKNEKGEPAPVDVYTLEVTAEEAEKLALAASEGRIQLALRNVTDGDDVMTEGMTIPKLLASYSHPQAPEVKPVLKKSGSNSNVKKVKNWAPRKTVTVEIIKGMETSKQRFTL
jgi:pilus assembly protein CpaB